MKKILVVATLIVAAVVSLFVFKNIFYSFILIIIAIFWPSTKDIANVLTTVLLLIVVYSFCDTAFVYPIRFLVRNAPNFRGTILITKDGEILYQATTEKSFDYQYLCASLSKQITAGLVMIENAKGNIELNKSANEYLPKKHKIDKKITVHHLLSHVSGIKKNGQAKFPPGSKYEYSNYGYIILRYLLENVTKKDYPTLVQELCHKLNMKNSYLVSEHTYEKMLKKHPKFLSSFVISKGKEKNIGDKLTWSMQKDGKKTIFIGNSCGGLISTVEDLNIWNKNLHNGNIIPLEQYKTMTFPYTKANFPEGLAGYGIYSCQEELYNIGYVDGYKATLSYFPDYKITLVILENSTYHNFKKDFQLHIAIRNTIRYWSRMRNAFDVFFTKIQSSFRPRANHLTFKD